MLVLDRDSRGATLYGRGRDIEDIDMAVEFDRRTCRWRPLGDAADVRRSDERKAILAALAKGAGPLSPGEVAELLGRSRDAVQQTLGRMVKDGEIAKAGRGKYTDCDIGRWGVSQRRGRGALRPHRLSQRSQRHNGRKAV